VNFCASCARAGAGVRTSAPAIVNAACFMARSVSVSDPRKHHGRDFVPAMTCIAA
jgi:hypothetical protein